MVFVFFLAEKLRAERTNKMKIKERKIPVREIFEGYVDSAELGVKAYGGLAFATRQIRRVKWYNICESR